MLAQWIGELVGQMHNNRVSKSQLAEHMGVSREYVSMVLNGHRCPKEAYRGTKNADDSSRRENYFLLVSEFVDKDGNTINVPVYIDEHAQINRVFIEVNKISTVFGRENFREYINRQIRNKNLVRIKNRSNQASERSAPIAEGYGKDASNSSIRNPNGIVKENDTTDSDSKKASIRKGENASVLEVAYRENLTEGLTDGERDALRMFNEEYGKLKDLTQKKAEQTNILAELKKNGQEGSEEATKARNRIGTLERMIGESTEKLQKYESYDTVQKLAEKVRPAAEKVLIEERKKELERYGTIPKGEKAVRESVLPVSTDGKNKVSRTARTVKEAGVTPDDFADLIDREVYLKDGMTYLPITNNETTQKAIDHITEYGWEAARGSWSTQVRSGKVSAELTAMGALLLNNAAKAGDKQTWLDVLHDYQIMSTNAGQAVQALRILKTLTPDDKLYMVQKDVNRMVKDLRLKRKIQVDSDLEAAYLAAETDEARDDIMVQIQQDVADQIPATFKDKWTALRYLNMLGNLRTQARNLAGNAVMGVTVEAKNLVAAGLEAIASICTGGEYQKNKALFASKDLMEAAFADYALVKSIVSDGGKYSDHLAASSDFARGVMEKRKIFKNKLREKYRTVTNWAMANGDVPFSKYAYARALAGYLKQHGFNNSDLSKADAKLLDDARQYAVQEAQEATFHDMNMVSKALSKRYHGDNKFLRFVNIGAEGVVPFRKTPANIAVRAEEYSPLGVINSLYYTVQAARENSDVTAAQAINSWAKTITGSALFLLGSLLAASGNLIGGPDDDEDRDRFEQMYGQQNYALKFGDTYITIDWASPAAIPMLMGAQFYKLKEENGFQFKDITGALSSLADPLIQMSMLQGINDALENVRYSDNNLIQLAINASLGYLTQGMTNTLLGQIERSFEDSRISTFVDENSPLPKWLQQQLGKVSAKIPGWDYNQIPYINAWGEEQENPNLLANMAYNMLSPSYITKDKEDAVYKELMRLDEIQSEVNVFPNTPSKEYEDRYLSADEYVELAKTHGKTQRQIIESMINSELYSKLPDQYKVKAIQFAYDYAREYAQIEVLGRDAFSSQWMGEIKGDIAEGIVSHVIGENIKGMYLNGDISADEAANRRVKYCEDTPTEAAEKVAYWKFQTDNPEYADWSENTVTRFKDLDVETAAHVVDMLDGLTPENGSTEVRTIQKLEAVARDRTLSNSDKNTALRAIMDDKLDAKLDSALNMGICMDEFTQAYREYLDTEGRGKKATVISYYRKTFGISETKAEDLYDLFAGNK